MRISDKVKEFVNNLIPSIDAQIEAPRRYDICSTCEQKDLRDNVEICKICGCRISGKVFDLEPQCPLNKH